jgi:Putative transmembrane protein (PGPGW)
MAARVRTWGREAGGWILLGLAVLFFPLPLVPSLLIAAGLIILSSRYEWAKTLLHKTKERFPSLFKKEKEPVGAIKAVS